MVDLSEKPLKMEEGTTESVEAGEDKGQSDTAPEQLKPRNRKLVQQIIINQIV